MKNTGRGLLMAFIVVLVFSACPIIFAEPVELKTVTYFPKNHPQVDPTALEWFKMLNESLQGKIQIKYVGGPEAIPSREQIEAVRNNMVQMCFMPTAVYKSVIPSVAVMSVVKFKDAMEMRKSTFTDYLVEEHAKAGVRYIGPGLWGQFTMWSKKPISKLGDLKGLKMRSFFLYDRFQKALGVTPVNIPTTEMYTALERGVVDGFCFPLVGPRDMGLTKSTKHVIAHQFYNNDVTLLMNLGVWNKLPKDVQQKIDDITAAKYEPYMMKHANELEVKEWIALEKEGVKKVTFNSVEAKEFVDLAYRVKWEELGESMAPDLVKKLKQLTRNE